MRKCLIYIGLLTGLLFCAAPLAQAQYFDWVKTYQSTYSSGSSPDDDNMIRSMGTDSQGNVYFIGTCVRGAAINGEELLAAVNHAEYSHNNVSCCIVKMSPSGEMLWHKAISDWYDRGCSGVMQMVGDSVMACYVSAPRPWDTNHPVLWLDSIVQYPDWFVPTDSIGDYSDALLFFDLDGNLKEQHFLNAGVLDSMGVPLVRDDSAMVAPDRCMMQCFHIDHDGNIIFGVSCGGDKGYRKVRCDTCERPVHTVTYTAEDGGVGAVRVMVDGTRSFFHHPENRPIMTNARLMKFSPHFDSLLEVRYLMQPRLDSPRTGLGVPGITDTRIMHIDSDPEGNLYVVGYIDVRRTDTIVPIDSAQGMTLHLTGNSTGFLVKYNPQLQPIYAKQLDGGFGTLFTHGMVKGDDVFLLGAGEVTNDSEDLYYDDSLLNDIARGATFFRLDKDDGRLLSYGKARPSFDNETWPMVLLETSPGEQTKLTVSNNRVATQVRFLGNIAFAGDTVRVRESPYYGMGTVMWDYDGHELLLIDHHAPNPDNMPIGALFTDSSLYLSGMFIGAATFGDTSFNVSHSTAYLARYVDTAFLHPYVHPTPPGPSAVPPIPPTTLTFTLSPNPTNGEVTVVLPALGEGAVLTVADATGREVRRQTLPPATEDTRLRLDLKGLPAGAYFVTVVTPQGSHTEKLVISDQ